MMTAKDVANLDHKHVRAVGWELWAYVWGGFGCLVVLRLILVVTPATGRCAPTHLRKHCVLQRKQTLVILLQQFVK